VRRAAWLPAHLAKSREETIQIYDDTAVITGEANIQVMVMGADAPTHLHVRHLNVWVKITDRWQMVAWELTRIG
jgi:hypothetical protein